MGDNILFRNGCQCVSCISKAVKDYNRAYTEWQSGKRDIVLQDWNWEDYENNSSDYGTTLSINGFELDRYATDVAQVLEVVMEFLQYESVEIEEIFE